MTNITVAPAVRDLSALAGQLSAWLRTKIADAANLRVENLTYPSGAGMSHETILFDASWTVGQQSCTQGCVVRIKPVGHTMFPDTLFHEQFRLMQVLHAHGAVRVARPLWFETDATLLGAPFFVMEKMHGRVPVSVPPYAQAGWVANATPVQRAKLWENGVRQLAAVQSVPLASVQFLQGPDGAAEGLAQEWDKYTRFVAWLNDERRWQVLEAGLERLHRSRPTNQPPGLVWGDARLGNIMFDDDFEVVAVMDWEQPSLGGALHDLAWWLVLSDMMHAGLEGMGTREQTLALWRGITGISTDDTEWYEDFTRLKLSCLNIRMATLRGTPLPTEAALAKRLKVA